VVVKHKYNALENILWSRHIPGVCENVLQKGLQVYILCVYVCIMYLIFCKNIKEILLLLSIPIYGPFNKKLLPKNNQYFANSIEIAHYKQQINCFHQAARGAIG